MKMHDVMTFKDEREELPVLDSKIGMVYEDDGLLVVDKPASLVCHSAGKYRFNTISNILKFEQKY